MSDGHTPTAQLRWLQLRMSGDIGFRHPNAIVPYAGSPVVIVLQQKWESACVGEAGQWRDIPVAAEPEIPAG
jgi:hypothetical protein